MRDVSVFVKGKGLAFRLDISDATFYSKIPPPVLLYNIVYLEKKKVRS